jgi:hypothetical protein
MSAASSPTRRLLPEGLEPESLVVGLSGLKVRADVAAAYAWCPVCELTARRGCIASTSAPSATFPGAVSR